MHSSFDRAHLYQTLSSGGALGNQDEDFLLTGGETLLGVFVGPSSVIGGQDEGDNARVNRIFPLIEPPNL